MTGYAHTNSKGITYYLHETTVTLTGGQPQTIAFFAKVPQNAKGKPANLPDDRVVRENPRNGFLTISKRKSAFETSASEPIEQASALVLGEAVEEVTWDVGVVQDPFGFQFKLAAVERVYVTPCSLLVAYLRELVAGGVPESELQRFIEENPDFLPGDHFEVMPQVILELSSGEELRPDFLLRPMDDLWDILELKRPDVPLITKSGNHMRMTHHMTSALAQLRDYADALNEPEVRDRLAQRYGIRTLKPRLQLIIGRSLDLNRETFRQVVHSGSNGVQVYTWDDVIEINERRLRQRRLR